MRMFSYERLLEGPQTESALRHRPWRPKEGGRRPFWSLPIYHQALVEKEAPHRGREHPQDPWQTFSERQGLEKVVAFSQLKANPDLTLAEHCQAFEDDSGMRVSEATMSRNIARLPGEWPLKKVEGSL